MLWLALVEVVPDALAAASGRAVLAAAAAAAGAMFALQALLV